MKKIAFCLLLISLLVACGGESSGRSSAAGVTDCSQSPTLGSTTFGTGCFK